MIRRLLVVGIASLALVGCSNAKPQQAAPLSLDTRFLIQTEAQGLSVKDDPGGVINAVKAECAKTAPQIAADEAAFLYASQPTASRGDRLMRLGLSIYCPEKLPPVAAGD